MYERENMRGPPIPGGPGREVNMMDGSFPFEKIYGGIAGFMFYATLINGCESVQMVVVLTVVYLLLIYLIFFAPGRWEKKKRKKKDE